MARLLGISFVGVDMADIHFVKKWPDGREVVVVEFTKTEARVRIGDEYRTLPIEEWRQIPPWNDGASVAAHP